MKTANAGIIGTGHAFGSEIVANDDLAERFGVTCEWIEERTGIRERRRATADEFALTLGARAARDAIEAAEIDATEIDLIVCTTVTPDYLQMPATACLIQAEIGANRAAAFDLAAACTGFIYGLEVAQKFVASGAYRRVLVVSVDLMTRCVDPDDLQTAILFADGAGAAVVAPVEAGRGILAVQCGSDGTQGDLICTPAGGARQPVCVETIGERKHFLKMRGRELFKVAVNTMPNIAQAVVKKTNLSLAEIALIIPHQANQRITNAVADKLGVERKKVFSNIEFVGNTGAATIPIALDQCLRSRRVKNGDTVLLTAFGGGITWGAAIVRF